jgi:hypothetical protein
MPAVAAYSQFVLVSIITILIAITLLSIDVKLV